MRIKLIIEYDGTNYVGWQRQTNGLSVQQVVEEAFEKASGSKAVLYSAGRTDAGVHARGQVAHLDTETSIPPEKISYAMNAQLPSDIRVVSSAAVSDEFHARYGAKAKTYVYTYINTQHPSAIHRNTTAHIRGDVDTSAMQQATKHIVGTHDFASFCASGGEVDTTVRTVYSLDVTRDEPFIKIEVTGSGFLYNMVRIIAGTLLDVGRGKLSVSAVKDIIAAKDRSMASPTAPARGLTMKQVYYDDAEFMK
ncbi:MAG: tRNA pseudouridine(38-40) synthase TruA [Clostridia bacterium]|jgi:tRNA pseudouridine38-40 synthase|nr:tRNA pseudouridine(38-40) synthase TruA [Clostridia bacterium]MBT7123168.1 tRNA pseudouridine(38-40) synthase TruA [Clostridia bacterium]